MTTRGLPFVAVALVLLACANPAPPWARPPAPAVCGDAAVAGAEECDDGNTDNADACLSTSLRPATWVPSDPHVHSHGCRGDLTPAELLALSAAQGNQITAALVWGSGYDDARRYFTGRDDPASGPGRILHYDLEVSQFPAGETGHLLLLGLSSLDFSPDPFRAPRSGIPVADWARAQGDRVVVGMAHGQFWPSSGRFPSPPVDCCMPWELVVDVVRGRVTFLETEEPGPLSPLDAGTLMLSQKLLNSGFKLAWAGASDYPCIHHVLDATTPRTDVLLQGELSYGHWLEALEAGRTAVAVGRGNHLNLRVNGAPLGSELRVAGGDTLALSIESQFGVAADVQVLSNGRVVAGVHVGAGAQVATVVLPVEGSTWLSAASRYVATSPIYVIADDRPIRASADDACYLIRYVDHLAGLVRSRRLDLGRDQELALAAYGEARAELERHFAEAGGILCR